MSKPLQFTLQMFYTAGFCSLPLLYGYWREGIDPGWYGVVSVLIGGFIAGVLVTTEKPEVHAPAPSVSRSGSGSGNE